MIASKAEKRNKQKKPDRILRSPSVYTSGISKSSRTLHYLRLFRTAISRRQANQPFLGVGFRPHTPWRTFPSNAHRLTAKPMPSAAAATRVLFPGSEAVLAIYRTVASRLKRHCSLLPARGTRNRRARRIAPVSSPASASGLLVLLCLAAWLASFRSGIAALLEKRLVFARKREFLSAVATGQLQILCHTVLSSTPLLYAKQKGVAVGAYQGKRLQQRIPSQNEFERIRSLLSRHPLQPNPAPLTFEDSFRCRSITSVPSLKFPTKPAPSQQKRCRPNKNDAVILSGVCRALCGKRSRRTCFSGARGCDELLGHHTRNTNRLQRLAFGLSE